MDGLEINLKTKVNNKDKAEVNKFFNDLKNQETIKMGLDIAKLKIEKAKAMKELRELKKTGDEQAIIKAQFKVDEFTDQITRAKAELRNFKNTGDKNFSLFQQRLNSVGSSIRQTFSDTFTFIGGLFAVDLFSRLTTQLFQAGSDLEEFQSKFNVVFGDVKDQANQTFEEMSQAIGRSELDLKNRGSRIGGIFNNMGFLNEESLKLSDNITRLAVDIASFNNVSDEQAVNALTAALTGEREMLKSLGIVISEADVKTEAYASGIAKAGEELTKKQEALATYNLLLKNSTDAQGDAIRTSESFANQLKRLGSVIRDTFAEAGQEVAQNTAGLLGTLSSWIQNYGVALIKTGLNTGKTLLSILQTAGKGFLQIFGLLSGKTSEAEQDQISFAKTFAKVVNWFRIGAQTIATAISSVGKIVGTIFGVMGQNAKLAGEIIFNAFKGMASGVASIFVGIGGEVAKGIDAAVNNVIKGINTLIRRARKIPGVSSVLKEVKFTSKLGEGMSGIGGIGADFSDLNASMSKLQANTDSTMGSLQDLTSELSKDWSSLANDIEVSNFNIESSFKKTGEGMKTEFDVSFDGINELIDKYSKEAPIKFDKAGKGSSKATKSAAKEQEKAIKEAIDNEIKAVELRTEKEKKAILESTMSHQDKINKIAKLERDMQEEILKIRGDEQKLLAFYNDENIKNAEERAKAEEEAAQERLKAEKELQEERKKLVQEYEDAFVDAYEEVEDKIDDSIDKIDDYDDKIAKLEDSISDWRDEAIEDIQDVNDELIQLNEDLSESLDKLAQQTQDKLVDAYVDARDEVQGLKDDLAGMDLGFDKEDISAFVSGAGLENVKRAAKEGGTIQTYKGAVDAGDLLEAYNLTQDLAKAEENLAEIRANTPEQAILDKEEYEALSPTQQILSDYEKEKQAIIANAQEERKRLKERKEALQAVLSGENVDLSQIEDKDTRELIAGKLEEKADIDAQIQALQQQKDSELEVLQGYNDKRAELERAYTAEFQTEITQREELMDGLIGKYEKLINLQQQLRDAGLVPATNVSNTTQNNNITVSNNVDAESLTRQISNQLQ